MESFKALANLEAKPEVAEEVRDVAYLQHALKNWKEGDTLFSVEDAETLLLPRWGHHTLINNLEKFQGIDQAYIAENVASTGEYGMSLIGQNIEKFDEYSLSKEVVLKVFLPFRPWKIMENLDKVKKEDHRELAIYLLTKTREAKIVVENLKKFSDEDYAYVLNFLIENRNINNGYYLQYCKDGTVPKEIAEEIINSGDAQYLIHRIKKFADIDQLDFCNKYIQSGFGDRLAREIHNIDIAHHAEVARMLIASDNTSSVCEYFEEFQNVELQDILPAIKHARDWVSLVEEAKKFPGQEKLLLSAILKADNYSFNSFLIGKPLLRFLSVDDVAGLIEKNDSIKSIYQGCAEDAPERDSVSQIIFALDFYTENRNSLQNFKNASLGTEIAISFIRNDDAHRVVEHERKFKKFNKQIFDTALELSEYGLATRCLDENVLSGVPLEELQKIIASNERLSSLCHSLEQIIPKADLLGRLTAALAIASSEIDENVSIERIKQSPFLGVHFTINPRMAGRLIAKIPEFDEVAQEHLAQLHAPGAYEYHSDFRNPAMREALLAAGYNFKDSRAEDTQDEISSTQTLNMLTPEIRQGNIAKLREYKSNPQILDVLARSGVDAERWLQYPQESRFNLAGDGSELLSAQIKSPLNRIVSELVGKLVGSFKEQFRQHIPKDSKLPQSLDAKYIDLTAKLTKVTEAHALEQDTQKRAGMEKGIAQLTKALAAYVSPAMQDTFFGELSGLETLGRALTENMLEAQRLQESTVERNREYYRTIKELDVVISQQAASIIQRFEKVVAMVDATAKELNMSYDLFESKELFEHFKEDAAAIQSIKESFAYGESNSLTGREITIGICNRNPYSSLYIGNYTGCCVSIEGGMHGGESPICDYLSDLGMQLVVAVDTTDSEKPLPVAVAWCYIGENNENNKPVFQIDNIEANTGYTDKYHEQFTSEMGQYLRKYADALHLPLYQGGANNDLTVAPIASADKLGRIYNRPDGYYLEAEGDDYEGDDGNEDEDDVYQW
ncbi:hypothetical protein A3C89_03720 [Candidatus Kaiserbacteria bacterium RIFCSPHIGHO2_02_FULL_50_50]|uniref:Uncharacterized protein n=1 Tax=Candidatus Kaiserbacteria bacterium RIFCSPHIGHO2_02_FULL_50_50 TaxID=1798492 RepID=A0A1F6DCC0_9BACT|nr:MAG: hypothetical protein A3C89_03720 [Candidatus Kaiserbacteria bacterium RIFCSPHIGHO2_02_FULL_50_50]OGG88053.1 MAG: hypothetical protein A3G62_01800 [Candidatus Kaiserbacteria bacterium RIFCSPLOWO2_12_FULL_50_10]